MTVKGRSRAGLASAVLAASWLMTLAIVRGAARAQTTQMGVSRELAQIYEADQADRENFTRLSPEQQRGMSERDKGRRARVAEIVDKGLLQSADDYFHAAMVFQHGDTP